MVALQLDPVISSGVVDHNAYLYQFLVFQFFVQTDKPTQRHTLRDWKQHLLRWRTSDNVIVQWSAHDEFCYGLVVANPDRVYPRSHIKGYMHTSHEFDTGSEAKAGLMADIMLMVAFPSSQLHGITTHEYQFILLNDWSMCVQLPCHLYSNVKWLISCSPTSH